LPKKSCLTRRDVLIGTAASAIIPQPSGARSGTDQPTGGAFIGRKGVNITAPFVGPSVQNGDAYFPNAYQYHRDVFHELKTWDQFKAVGHLERIKAAGFDHVRMIIDPGPLVLARSEKRSHVYERYLLELLAATGDILKTGLFVVVNFHPQRNDTSPVNWQNTIGGGTSNPLYVAYRSAASEFAASLVTAWDTARVCLEPYNEPAPADKHDVPWVTRCQDMHAAIRATAGHDLTVIWGPDTWYDWKRLTEFKAVNFDGRTSWAFHAYEPRLFTYQGYPRSLVDSPYHFVSGLRFPPNHQNLHDAISAAVARIEGEKGLDARQKMQFIKTIRRDLSSYFRTFQNSSSFYTSVLAPIVQWAERENLPGDRIFCNEFGVNRDWPLDWAQSVGSTSPVSGALLQDRANYLGLVVAALEAENMRWTCFDWCGPDFGLSSLDGNFTLLPGIATAMRLAG
jgi:hypothetical protein